MRDTKSWLGQLSLLVKILEAELRKLGQPADRNKAAIILSPG